MDEPLQQSPGTPPQPRAGGILSPFEAGLSPLRDFGRRVDELDDALAALVSLGDDGLRRRVSGLRRGLRRFEPSVTVIGQVKAGKTSLLNAMIGWPDLLPADVNPWTSVVTSLHLTPRAQGAQTGARFRFFDEADWNGLLAKGGRLGELAQRAGAGDELAKIQCQLEKMREKSRARLGRKFELLLGQTHEYAEVDPELIERYVCLGELPTDGGPAVEQGQGRFADITRSADVYLHRPELPVGLCLRDTPGVNDTFMVREQTTIRAIRESRLCAVVLSAHQALSTVDMALIRLITNIKSRDIVIFVNRIDELSDPVNQVAEIRQSIVQTLARHNGPADPQVIFGSAFWAHQAMAGSGMGPSPAVTEALLEQAAPGLESDGGAVSARAQLWRVSGVPALYAALSRRIVEGEGADVLNDTAVRAGNLAQGIRVAAGAALPEAARAGEVGTAMEGLSALEAQETQAMQVAFAELAATFHARLDVSHQSFLKRATASLLTHLDQKGERVIWEYNPDGLRMMFQSAYAVFGTRVQKLSDQVFETAGTRIAEHYGRVFGTAVDPRSLGAPNPPRIPPPVFLGQTIALDLKGPWWKGWWRRRKGADAFAADFRAMIEAETAPLVETLKHQQADEIAAALQGAMKEFFADQQAILAGVRDGGSPAGPSATGDGGASETVDRKHALEAVLGALQPFQERTQTT